MTSNSIPARSRSRILTVGALLLSSLAAMGCACTATVPLGAERYAPRPAGHPLATYDGMADVPRPFVKVGRIRGRGSLFGSVIEAIEREARLLGADALVLRDEPRCRLGCDRDLDEWSVVAVRWRQGDLPLESRKKPPPG